MKSFIDCHCHAFNFVDVPMYLTLTDKVNVGTVGRIKAAAGVLLLLPKLLVEKNAIKNKVEEYKEFILFFERGLQRNVEMILSEIRGQLDQPNNTETLITPLVMDFDILLEQEMKAQMGKEPSVREQFKRLESAINAIDFNNYPNMKVCPFVGLDLRKLKKTDKVRLNGFKTFFNNNNTLGKTSIRDLGQGKILGIKLYPPIGFNPNPPSLPPKYRDFYTWCCDEDIPITVHCQTGSYSAGKEKEKLDRNTTPENWKNLLKKPEFNNLRINFAHFGGETGTDDMFEPFRIDKSSWTYIIIELLKIYPNTYADFSAYDYDKAEHRKNLMKIFEKDAEGDFDISGTPNYKLRDKLIWGSDIPMVISGKSYRKGYASKGESNYKYYFQGFVNSVNGSKKLSDQEKQIIISNIVDKNPKKFLRIF